MSPSVRGYLVKMLITLETLYILHHPAGNDQLAFNSLVLTTDTDYLRSERVVHITVS